MLCGLAMKKRWSARRKAAGEDFTKPNLVMGAETHVCWEKFCRYWCAPTRRRRPTPSGTVVCFPFIFQQ